MLQILDYISDPYAFDSRFAREVYCSDVVSGEIKGQRLGIVILTEQVMLFVAAASPVFAANSAVAVAANPDGVSFVVEVAFHEMVVLTWGFKSLPKRSLRKSLLTKYACDGRARG